MTSNSSVRSYLSHDAVRKRPRLLAADLLPKHARAIAEHYASDPSVRLIMTIGSLSANDNDAHSDVDLVLVCDNSGIPSKEDRLQVIDKVSNGQAQLDYIDLHIWTFGTSDDFRIDGQEICTQFFTKDFMEQKIDLIIGGFYNQVGMEHPLASLASLYNARVHIDKDGYYKTLRRKIDPYPTQLRKNILAQELDMRYPYYLNRLETALNRGDVPFAYKMIQGAIDSAIYIIFASHGKYPKGPKRLYKQLESFLPKDKISTFQEHFHTLFGSGYAADNLQQKLDALKKLHQVLKQQP